MKTPRPAMSMKFKVQTIPELTTKLEYDINRLIQSFEEATGMHVWVITTTSNLYRAATTTSITLKVDTREENKS